MGFFGWFKQEKQEPKFCKDCKNVVLDTTFPSLTHGIEFSKCAIIVQKADLVTGIISYNRYCSTERKYGACGPKGKNFQPKENQ